MHTKSEYDSFYKKIFREIPIRNWRNFIRIIKYANKLKRFYISMLCLWNLHFAISVLCRNNRNKIFNFRSIEFKNLCLKHGLSNVKYMHKSFILNMLSVFLIKLGIQHFAFWWFIFFIYFLNIFCKKAKNTSIWGKYELN